MNRVLALVVVAACGNDVGMPPPAALPERVWLVTDAQYANAVRDLLGVESPPIHSPGTQPHQLIHDDTVLAVDAPLLVQYRLAAETIAREVDTIDIEQFASRAFRRPLDDDERARLAALHAQGGAALVVEAVLQSPSFIYRSELGPELGPYELASSLGFLFLDSIPDEPLWQAARDGTIADPAVAAAHIDRLLELPRVRAHLTDVVMQWLQLHAIGSRYGLTDETRASMLEQTRRFVDAVLWHRGGSLRELLVSRDTFVDARLANYYGVSSVDWHMSPRTVERSGILTHPGLLAMLGSPGAESIIKRGIYLHRTFLCTEELGRPPFAAIAETASMTAKFSEAQRAHFRAAHVYCSDCHRKIDPPGFALHRYDGDGRERDVDEIGVVVDDEVVLELDGTAHKIRGAAELAHVLAESEQVARCVVDQIAHHALGRAVTDPATRGYLHRSFYGDRDLVALFRTIATTPLFRRRR